MYGTIFRLKVKSGQEDNVAEVFREWDSERKPKIEGALGGLLLKPDNGSKELIGVAVFKDKAAYAANAGDPAQDKWYTKLRELLEADPVWEDGEYVTSSIG